MSAWQPEIVVDEPLVLRLLGQFPELDVRSLEEVAAGWDNGVWLVNDRWAFRFPRRQIAIPGVEREIAMLPAIAPLVALPIPVPRFVGRPTDEYPWPFFGGPHLTGREATGLSDAARTRLAADLGAFLRRLHGLDLGHDLPADFNRRSDMSARVPLAREQLANVERVGLWEPPPLVDDLLAHAERLPVPRASALVHGDVHFRHLLVDEDDRLAGVIDWGDVCRADPCIDLQVLWSFFPAEGRRVFLDAYGPVSEEQLVRARVLALSVNAALAAYGHAEALADVAGEAVEALRRSTT